jgi:hypothetical protein
MRLEKRAAKAGSPRAALARELLREALDRRDAVERARRLAADYTAGRSDARKLLDDLEGGQLELLGDEDA